MYFLHCRQLYPLPTLTVHKNRRSSSISGSERRHIVRQGITQKTCRYLWFAVSQIWWSNIIMGLSKSVRMRWKRPIYKQKNLNFHCEAED